MRWESQVFKSNLFYYFILLIVMEKRKNTRWHQGPKPVKEYEEKLLEMRRVTRVNTGGRQLSFRATILVWNRKWKIWLGVAKGADVQIAVTKATHDAYKNIKECHITPNWTLPYQSEQKFKATRLRLIPAAPGTWLKAGSTIRPVLELAGYTNALSKRIGSNNPLNNALLAITILTGFKTFNTRFKIISPKITELVEDVTEELLQDDTVEITSDMKWSQRVTKRDVEKSKETEIVNTPMKKTVSQKPFSPKPFVKK